MNERQRGWGNTIRAFAPIFIGVLVVVAVVWFQTADRREPASKAEMHRYRVSQLSDQELRVLHEKAVMESAMRSAKRAETRALNMERCADPAYRARNRTSCSAPITGHGLILPSVSVDAVFDEMLLGVCAYASSRHDARELGCLP